MYPKPCPRRRLCLSLLMGICALSLSACDSGKDKVSLPADQLQAAKERTRPVGQVTIGDPKPVSTTDSVPTSPAAPTANAAVDPGKKAYDTFCVACHAAGVAGAPKVGDKAAWAPRAAQGLDTLYAHAIAGFQGKVGIMPAKGGGTSLSDEEVKAAVRYLLEQSGAGTPAATPAKSNAANPNAATQTSPTPDALAKGKTVVDKSCAACHGPGIAGAPKIGDKAGWAPRIAQGGEVLVKHALEGFGGSAGIMPPKGGFADLTDEDVRKAVEYMVEQSK